jgi:hypothetical protein
MALIDGKQFIRIIRRYHCDEDIKAQIREFIITAMIPDEDVIRNHCIVELADRSKRLFNRPRQTKYFNVVFYVMYYQIGQVFTGEPVLEITYDAAWELSKEVYEFKIAEQLKERSVLSEAKKIINPSCIG